MRRPDRRVVGTRVHYEDALIDTIVVTSEGLALREERPELALAALAVAEEAGTVERATGSHGSSGPWVELQEWGHSAWQIGERAVLQLNAPPVRAGRYPVVLDPASAGVLAHRAVGHGCEADADAVPVGTRLGSGVVTIGDDGTAFGRRGTMAFDHEGTAPVPTILVQHGVVVGHVHSRITAARAGTGATGNARGAGLEPPRARLGYTYVASGQGELADLLADIPLGVYVADPVGVSLDDTRAGIRAGLARMIRRGELAEPIKGVTLGADPLVLLGLVDRVAADFTWNGAASCCDRAAAGRVPVSTGAPHVRLIEAPVGELA
jgi:TldD protein